MHANSPVSPHLENFVGKEGHQGFNAINTGDGGGWQGRVGRVEAVTIWKQFGIACDGLRNLMCQSSFRILAGMIFKLKFACVLQ